MKKKHITWTLLLAAVALVGCNEDEVSSASGGDIEITEKLPTGTFTAEVTGLSTIPDVHYLLVMWTEPADAGVDHYLVEWKGRGVDNNLYSETVKAGTGYLLLERLYNEQYDVTVKCGSKDYLYSTGVATSGAPITDNTPPGLVEDVELEPLAVSAAVTWSNPTDDDLEKIRLTVFDITNDVELLSLSLPSYTESYQVVNLTDLTEYRVSISTEDYLGNASTLVDKTMKTLTERQLDKSVTPWTVADFSAEETVGEGANGRAAQAIDTDDATYWHSPWYVSSSVLPQWIVIDLHQEVIPTVLISYRRNNSSGPTSVKIEGCLDLDADDWLDFGTFSLVATVNDGQNCNLINPKRVRYVKYTVLASPNGYAMVRNINIRALVDE